MTRGAIKLYERYIRPFAKKYEKQIDAIHDQIQDLIQADKEKKN